MIKKLIERTPTLQSKTRTGKVKYWYGEVFETDEGVFVKKVWWQDGSVVQESTPVHIKGKNLGKVNETTDVEQAIFDLNSIMQKQRDKGYSEDGSQDHIPTKPMLAHSYEKRSHNIQWPAFVQPKLDGFRMIFDGQRGWTRGAKEHVPECIAHLRFDNLTGYELDGELILPGNRPLQETASAAKKFRPGVSDQLRYVVYDLVAPNLPYAKRLDILYTEVLPVMPINMTLIQTHLVESEEEMFEKHVDFTSAGFEGTIIRNTNGRYAHNRSPDLQKYKDFQDDEFEIVDVTDGVGSFKGKAVFVCTTDTGNTFNVVPRGTMEDREALYETRGDHIGKKLTVRYQSLSNAGIPVFPIGVIVREDWDVS